MYITKVVKWIKYIGNLIIYTLIQAIITQYHQKNCAVFMLWNNNYLYISKMECLVKNQ
jgi:hypothetical protein